MTCLIDHHRQKLLLWVFAHRTFQTNQSLEQLPKFQSHFGPADTDKWSAFKPWGWSMWSCVNRNILITATWKKAPQSWPVQGRLWFPVQSRGIWRLSLHRRHHKELQWRCLRERETRSCDKRLMRETQTTYKMLLQITFVWVLIDVSDVFHCQSEHGVLGPI